MTVLFAISRLDASSSAVAPVPPVPPVPSALRLNGAIQKAEKVTGHSPGRMSEKLMNLGELHTFLTSVARMMASQHPIVDSVK